MPKQPDSRWTDEQIELGARIYPSDVARALALINEGSPELFELVQAQTDKPTTERKLSDTTRSNPQT